MKNAREKVNNLFAIPKASLENRLQGIETGHVTFKSRCVYLGQDYRVNTQYPAVLNLNHPI